MPGLRRHVTPLVHGLERPGRWLIVRQTSPPILQIPTNEAHLASVGSSDSFVEPRPRDRTAVMLRHFPIMQRSSGSA
jgi:hypothetical protein